MSYVKAPAHECSPNKDKEGPSLISRAVAATGRARASCRCTSSAVPAHAKSAAPRRPSATTTWGRSHKIYFRVATNQANICLTQFNFMVPSDVNSYLLGMARVSWSLRNAKVERSRRACPIWSLRSPICLMRPCARAW